MAQPQLGGSTRPGLSTMRAPALAIEVDRFEPSFDARAAEHDDRVRSLKGLLDDEVAARAAQQHGGRDHRQDGSATAARRTMRRIRVNPALGMRLSWRRSSGKAGLCAPPAGCDAGGVSLRRGGLRRRADPCRTLPA